MNAGLDCPHPFRRQPRPRRYHSCDHSSLARASTPRNAAPVCADVMERGQIQSVIVPCVGVAPWGGGRRGLFPQVVGYRADFIGELLLGGRPGPDRTQEWQLRKWSEPRRSDGSSSGSTAIDGWTVVGGNVSYVGNRWQHSQGLRSVSLPCGGGISQTFETEPNLEYKVRFNMAGDPNTTPAVKTLEVSFDASNAFLRSTRPVAVSATWAGRRRSWIFVTADPMVTLTFSSPTTGCSTPAVDNVRTMANEIGVRAQPDATTPGSRRAASLHGDPLRR